MIDATARRRPPALSRLGLRVFGLIVVVALITQIGMSRMLQSTPVFGSAWQPARVQVYAQLAGSVDPLIVKYGHALRSDRFAYGLFGSSRGMGLSHDHLGLKASEFFNFSTGSTGFRQSVALIQALHDAGKAPDTILLTMDNYDIGYFRHVEWPSAFASPLYHLGYMKDEIAAGTSLRIVAVAAVEAVKNAVYEWVSKFHFERLLRFTRFFGTPNEIADNLFRPDGSRDMEALASTHPPLTIYSTPWPSMIAGMKADIVRLGRVAAAGHRIIIYETPVAPHLLAELNARRDQATVRLREDITQACRQHGIICVPPPAPVSGDEHMMWTSGSHAPPAVLARHVAGLL